MIEMRQVTKRFDDTAALDGLTLTVPAGSVYGMVGPNGAGKSTAIRCIAGILRPDAGEVLVGGEPVFENTAAKARIACIPDDPAVLPQASIDDMRRFYKKLYPRFDDEVFSHLAEAFPLDPKQAVKRFSRGMRKQAAFWLAMGLCSTSRWTVSTRSCGGRCGASSWATSPSGA